MMPPPAPGFTGSPLIRAEHERDDPDGFAASAASLSARLLRLDGLTPQVDDMGGLCWGSLAEADPADDLALLGTIDGKPRFVALAAVREDPAMRSAAMNAALTMLLPEEAATYAIARCLVDWHARNRFCPRCGTATRSYRSGWARHCDPAAGGCGAEHFPRTEIGRAHV
jgi:NAD+ diphosphatase